MAVTVLTLSRNDTGPLTVTVPWQTLSASNGLNPYHTGSGKLWFNGKFNASDPDTLTDGVKPGALFEKTLASGIVVTTDGNNTTTNGVVSITLAPADTQYCPADYPVTLYCSLKGFDGANEFTIVKDIHLVVSPQSTSSVS